jgi:hypothetical protein
MHFLSIAELIEMFERIFGEQWIRREKKENTLSNLYNCRVFYLEAFRNTKKTRSQYNHFECKPWTHNLQSE